MNELILFKQGLYFKEDVGMAHRIPQQPKPKVWLSENWTKKKIADYKPFNFVDGEGIRCSVYVSGCLFNCPGCYNKIAQDFSYGVEYTKELEDQIIADLGQSYVQGLTLLGGEPFLNTPVLLQLCERVRREFGQTKDIWSWTGYKWENLQQESEDKLALLSYVDVLVDGPFILAEKDLTKAFRGSHNQRIIDVAKTRDAGEVILYIDD